MQILLLFVLFIGNIFTILHLTYFSLLLQIITGELSLIAALAANHLVKSHMEHNRKPTALEVGSTAAGASIGTSNHASHGGDEGGGNNKMRKNISMPELAARNIVTSSK